MILYRPVGPDELQLIKDAEYRSFPPRLPEQPLFYPVLNLEYAFEINRWNQNQYGRGAVVRFEVDDAFVSRYQVQCVGARYHLELWVHAEELDEFNRHILGPIQVIPG